MSYEIFLKRSAEKELNRVPKNVYHRIISKLTSLEDNPLPRGSRKVIGTDAYRIRVGDYRILYFIDHQNKIVEIISISHRKNAYRK